MPLLDTKPILYYSADFTSIDQGIIDSTRTKTFAKEPELAKLLRRLKSTPALNNKKSSPFFLACLQWQICCVLGALLRDNLQMGAFSYHRFIFLLACIDHWKVYNWLVFACTVKTAIKVKRQCVSTSKTRHCCRASSFLTIFFVCLRRK